MIFHHVTRWLIGVIAVLILVASISSSASLKLRKPRRRPTTRIPLQRSRVAPLIVKLIPKYFDDTSMHGVSSNCTSNICRNARKFNFDANKASSEQDNFLSDEESLRYVVYPKKYEHFVSKKNTGHISHRYKRNVALTESLSNANNQMVVHYSSNAIEALMNESKRKLKKVTLEKARKHMKIKESSNSLSEVNRTRRDLNYPSRRNASDYYAQRRAVMERYYARQREINARYANQTGNITRLRYNDISQHTPITPMIPITPNNATRFRLSQEYTNKNSRNSVAFRHPSIKIDPIHNNDSWNNGMPTTTELDNRRDIALENDLGFKFNADIFRETKNSSNIERNALDYVTPTPCTNVSLSGTFAPKTRSKPNVNCTHKTGQTNENSVYTNTSDRIWGKCEGELVYQHNLALGLKGPSNLEVSFEAIIEATICITCVKISSYNATRAMVMLESGGRGHGYVRLKLKGYENEGFTYIIKVWGVLKVNEDCSNMD